MSIRDKVVAGFVTRYGQPPDVVVRAPGRVNLLGGHTDYNEGYVLPAAIDRAAWVAAAVRTDRQSRVLALDREEEAVFDLDAIAPRQGNWSDYPRGVAWALSERGLALPAIDASLASDVPVGAGLSSSAAVEVAFAWAWRTLAGFDLDRISLALACQQAENDYVGVRCGVMDQVASACGRAGHALLLDCRTLQVDPVLLPETAAIVVADSRVRRSLAASEYNRRRQECEEVVRQLQRELPHVRSLRDVSPETLAQWAHRLPVELYRRARHVVTGNARVLTAAAALRCGDLAALGEAMRRCHESLRDDYQVSSPELDLLAETAWSVGGCYGARLTGAGFGGCVVAVVDSGAAGNLVECLKRAFRDHFGQLPAAYTCHSADGVTAQAALTG